MSKCVILLVPPHMRLTKLFCLYNVHTCIVVSKRHKKTLKSSADSDASQVAHSCHFRVDLVLLRVDLVTFYVLDFFVSSMKNLVGEHTVKFSDRFPNDYDSAHLWVDTFYGKKLYQNRLVINAISVSMWFFVFNEINSWLLLSNDANIQKQVQPYVHYTLYRVILRNIFYDRFKLSQNNLIRLFLIKQSVGFNINTEKMLHFWLEE